MAQNKFLDLTGLTHFWGKIKNYIDTLGEKKVDKVDGKQLSTEDYTSEEKSKLAGLKNYTLPEASSETLGGIKVGTGLEVTEDGTLNAIEGGKADSVDWEDVIGRPTKLSEFENDSKFQTDVQVTTAVSPKADKTYVDEQLAIKADKGHKHTKLDITDFPTKLSEFTNDSGYQTAENVKTLIANKADKSYVDGELAKKATTDALTSGLAGKSDKGHTHKKSEITDMPTKLSEFQNDSKFQTDVQVSSSIAAAIGEVVQFDVQVLGSIEDLSEEGEKGVFYLVPNSGSDKNVYDEYIWTGEQYECLGARDIDLSGYVQQDDLLSISNGEIDSIIAA